MAGTDRSSAADGRAAERPHAPAVVLVKPQLGENVGAVARAMLNCGLLDLRLVAPRDGWPNERAWATASGAVEVLDRVRIFADLESAVADLHRLYATTARRRDMTKEVLTPRAAATEIHELATGGARAGLLFGPERIGLTNDEVALADTLLHVPLNPAFSSLNLAQAVLVVVYEWYQAGIDVPARALDSDEAPASREQLLAFFDHLDRALEAAGFFKVEAMRPTMERNLRNLFHRAALTGQEVQTLHGVVTALVGRRLDELDPAREKPPRTARRKRSHPP